MDDMAQSWTTTLPAGRAAYSDRTAAIMACFSQLAYIRGEKERLRKNDGTPDKLEADLRGLGFTLLEAFDDSSTDTQAFLAETEDYAVLAFRGTEANFRDILNDLNVKHSASEESTAGEPMEGFAIPFQAIENKIELALAKLTGKPIFITGHSLGAALATLATQAYEKRFPISACYTFGSPRVGSSELEQNLRCSVYRIKNHRDIVTTVPLFTWNYQHVGSLYYLDGLGKMIRSPNIKILAKEAARAFFGYFTGWPRILAKFWKYKERSSDSGLAPPAFRDHSIAAYLDKLNTIANSRNPMWTLR